MIPTMIFFGLLLGRWPRTCLVAAAILWPLLLLSAGVLQQADNPVGTAIGGGLLAAANAGVGVLAHQALLRLIRVITSAITTFRTSRHHPSGPTAIRQG